MSDSAVTKNTEQAVKHAAKAAEAAVEPVKDVLVEVGKAKWVTGKNLAIAGVAVVVAGTAVVAYRKVRAIKAAKNDETNED